ncbi:hypothetical protein GCM10019016_037380 [Streptomyces prasinosporus]|uniref:gluconokinase n=1 Tax=Streptomyces prasinosporus TaxID=68256 RepID=A0ABP6TNP6_9ACTN
MAQGRASGPQVAAVMGVTGTGKTTVGVLLAALLGVPYAEGDDFHTRASTAKTSSGEPLTDADRWPWLDKIGAWARGRAGLGGGDQRFGAAQGLPRAGAGEGSRDRLRAPRGRS